MRLEQHFVITWTIEINKPKENGKMLKNISRYRQKDGRKRQGRMEKITKRFVPKICQTDKSGIVTIYSQKNTHALSVKPKRNIHING